MIKGFNFLTILLLTLQGFILFSCSSAQVREDTAETTEDRSASVESEKSEKVDKEEEVLSETPVKDKISPEQKKKEEELKKESANFDGNTYRGPALKEFQDGLGKYFTDGCEPAMELWKNALKKDAKRSDIPFNIGLCYERSGNLGKSKEWYIKAFNIDKNFLKPLYNYALSIGDNLKNEKDFLVNLVEETEDLVEKNNFLAWLYIHTNDMGLAEKHAKIALKEDEQNVDAVVSLATIYHRNEMYELADMALGTALQWDTNNFRLQRLYGFLNYDMGRKGKATEHFQAAIKLNPELPEVRNMLAVLAMEIEDYNTAKNHLEFALKINPDFISAKINLSMAYKGLDKFKEARDILVELEKIEGLPLETAKVVNFNLGILYLDADVDGTRQLERFDTAVNYLNKYLALIKKDGDFRQRKALIDEYIKEANNEKKRLELFLRTQERMLARKKAMEEEHKLFLKNKEAAFKAAVEEDTLEALENYIKKFPVLGPEDKLSNAVQARLTELKKQVKEESGNTESELSPEEENQGVSDDSQDTENDEE